MRNSRFHHFYFPASTLLVLALVICSITWAVSARSLAKLTLSAQTPAGQKPQPPASGLPSPAPLPAQTPAPGKDDEPQAITERITRPKAPEARVLQPGQFANFRFPLITSKGEIAFLGLAINPEDRTHAKQAIFIRQPDGTWKVVREGEKSAEQPGGVFSFGLPSIADNGDLIFMGEPPTDPKTVPLVLDPNDPAATNHHPMALTRGLYVKTATGTKNVLKLGGEVPNMPSTLTGISNATVNSQGTIAFIGTYVDPDGRGMFYIEGGKPRIIARSGQKIGYGSEMTFSEHYYPSQINERNEVAFLSRLGSESGIFVSRPAGIELITMTGKPAPLKETSFIGFGNRAPAINNKGEIVFVGFTNNAEVQRALFFKGEGPMRMVVRSGEQIGDTTNAFTDFYNPVINGRGEIAFLGKFGGRSTGIFLKTAKGIEQVAVTDQVIPGGDRKKEEVFNNFTQPALNDRGEIVFYAQIKTGDTAIFHRDEKGVLHLVARRGDPMPK